MESQARTLKASIDLPYEVSLGDTWARFFDGLANREIWGVRCEKCHRVLVPARSFCPRCFTDTDDWVKVSDEGSLVAWVLTNYRYHAQPIEPPFITGLIRLDGTDVNFMHLVGGFDVGDLGEARKRLTPGARVKAVWKEERSGHILDIDHFALV